MKFKDIIVYDVYELAKFYVGAFNVTPHEDWTIATISQRLQWVLEQNGSYGLKAYNDEGKLAGFIMGAEELFFESEIFKIMEFCVAGEQEDRGIAEQIFREFEEQLTKRGYNRIVLFTTKDGIGFYKQIGMVPFDSMVMMGKQL